LPLTAVCPALSPRWDDIPVYHVGVGGMKIAHVGASGHSPLPLPC
jgi:hypothetical protein